MGWLAFRAVWLRTLRPQSPSDRGKAPEEGRQCFWRHPLNLAGKQIATEIGVDPPRLPAVEVAQVFDYR